MTLLDLIGLDFEISRSFKSNAMVKLEYSYYDFPLVFNRNIRSNSAPLRDTRQQNPSDMDGHFKVTLD